MTILDFSYIENLVEEKPMCIIDCFVKGMLKKCGGDSDKLHERIDIWVRIVQDKEEVTKNMVRGKTK